LQWELADFTCTQIGLKYPELDAIARLFSDCVRGAIFPVPVAAADEPAAFALCPPATFTGDP
jgi:hypothetical protein